MTATIDISAEELKRMMLREYDEVSLDASEFTRAWLSVAQASAKRPGSAVLDKTILIEGFEDGIRLVATDGYIFLCSWVPYANADEPDLSEAPLRSIVVTDADGRAKNLLSYALNLASGDAPRLFNIRLRFGSGPDDAQGSLDGLRSQYVGIVLDEEVLFLPVVESEFPTWRALVKGFSPIETDAIALSPDIVERLAKIGKWHPNAKLVWKFGGSDKLARIHFSDAEPAVWGGVMPARLAEKAEESA